MNKIALILLVAAFCTVSCKSATLKLEPRQLAKAAQAHMQGALLGSQMSPQDVMAISKPEPNADVGAALFARYCDSCHVSGSQGPRLVGVYNASPDSDSDISVLRYGLVKMPAFRNILTRFQILDVLRYLQVEYARERGVETEEKD